LYISLSLGVLDLFLILRLHLTQVIRILIDLLDHLSL
jgi:hypothetical protein